MSQPPYHDPNQPAPERPYAYPPPVDPYGHPPTSGPGYPAPASGPPGYGQPGYGQPGYGQPGYASPGYAPPGPQYPEQGHDPNAGYATTVPASYDPNLGYPQPPAAEPPKKRRGLLIIAIVLAVAVLLAGGGAAAYFFFLRDTDGKGKENATVAVQEFLAAVYTEPNVDKASQLVCSEARNRTELAKKIDEVKAYQTKYKEPKFSWAEPTVVEQKSDSAKVTVNVRMTTEDEKVADEPLRITVVKKTGWFVCEVAPQ